MKIFPLRQSSSDDMIHNHFVDQFHEHIRPIMVRRKAIALADNIANKIRQRRLDPSNVLVLFGEHHDSLSHKLSEIWTTERLQHHYPNLSVCVESPKQGPEKCIPDDCRRKDWLETAASLAEKQKANLADRLIPSYCKDRKIDCHPIDAPQMSRHSRQKDMIYMQVTGTLPANVVKRYRNDPAYREHLERYPHLLKSISILGNRDLGFTDRQHIGKFSAALLAFQTIERGPYISSTESAGLLRRDMHMAEQLRQLRDKGKGPILSINGDAHLLDDRDRMPNTLLEMALSNGHDVFAITQQSDSGSPERNNIVSAFLSFLDEEKAARLHGLYHRYHLNPLLDPSYNTYCGDGYRTREHCPQRLQQAASKVRIVMAKQR